MKFMNFEKMVLIISSISFVIGIFILLYFTYISQTPKFIPSTINEDFIGRKISITGKIINVVKREKVNYITISDDIKNFTITVFPDVFRIIENRISIGKKIEVTGILSVYRGNLQIILQNPENLKILE